MSTLREAAEALLKFYEEQQDDHSMCVECSHWLPDHADDCPSMLMSVALRSALREPKERSTGGSTLPGAMTPEFVHAREVAVAIGRVLAGESVEVVERDYGFPGGMLAALSPPEEKP